jgi:hypothetical protein
MFFLLLGIVAMLGLVFYYVESLEGGVGTSAVVVLWWRFRLHHTYFDTGLVLKSPTKWDTYASLV